jgi:hypothetical protein
MMADNQGVGKTGDRFWALGFRLCEHTSVWGGHRGGRKSR